MTSVIRGIIRYEYLLTITRFYFTLFCKVNFENCNYKYAHSYKFGQILKKKNFSKYANYLYTFTFKR